MKREVASLNGKKWKPAPADCTVGVLRTSRIVYWDGAAAYWSGNAFAFSTFGMLQKFIDICPKTPNRLRSVIVGKDNHTEKDGDFVREKAWPINEWPQTLDILSMLPELKSFELCIGSLWGQSLSKAFEESLWGLRKANMPFCLRDCTTQMLTAYYARDILIRRIPDEVVSKLKSLKLRYRTNLTGRPDGYGWSSCEILQYARDVRVGAWAVCPFEKRDKIGRRVPKDGEESTKQDARLWLEARAAAHWDHSVPPSRGV